MSYSSIINWPSAKGLDMAIKKFKTDPLRYWGSTIAPLITTNFQTIEYDEIHGPQGLASAHTLDSDPKMVKYPKVVVKSFKPMYFKEFHRISESDMLKLRRIGDVESRNASTQEIIGRGLDNLNHRLESRIEQMRWSALLTGQVAINENGVVMTATYGVPAGNLAKTVGVSWDTPSTAKPVSDILAINNSFIGSGYQMRYVLMNSNTATKFCLATDTKTFYGAGIREKVLPGNLSLYGPGFYPGTEWKIYDEGYLNDAGTFVPFIPDNKIVFLGNAPVGEIIDVVSTPSLHSPDGTPTPGKFAFAIDKSGQKSANPHYDIVAGIYGLPRIRRPEALMVMDVTDTGA